MEAEILDTLERYAEAYCAKDVEGLMALFDDGDDVTVIGTGADELCVGPAAIRALFTRNFAEAAAEKFDWHWTKTTIRGDAAVVAATFTIHIDREGEKIVVPLRWTIALRNSNSRWRWLHRHASAAAANQDDGKAYPTSSRQR